MSGSAALRRPFLSAVVLAGVAGTCVFATWLGISRHDEYTFYFYEFVEAGHPGVVNILGTAGMFTAAVLAAVMSIMHHSVAWRVAAVLLALVSVDDLMRLHNHVAGGDVAVRLLTWGTLAWVLHRLRREVVLDRHARSMLILGAIGYVASEALDVAGGDPHGIVAVLEESSGVLSSWCFALAMVGITSSALLAARAPNVTEVSPHAPLR